MEYIIVADSSADLGHMATPGFRSVPLKIVTDEKEFVDDSQLDLDALLDYLAGYKGRSGSSCPSVGDWLEAFGDAEAVFVVAITSGLSGSYNAAVQAAGVYMEQHPDRKVCCLDSLSAGPELALTVEKLQELIGAGLSFEETEIQIRAYMKTTHLLFSLESLNNLARNGRVSTLVAKAAGLLGIRVVGKASSEGTLQPMHKARGENKAMAVIAREIREAGFRSGKVRIDHCRNEAAADALAGLIREDFPDADIKIGLCSGLCSFYAEKGGLLVGFEA